MKCSGISDEQYVSDKLMSKGVNMSNEILIGQGSCLLNFSKTQKGITNTLLIFKADLKMG